MKFFPKKKITRALSAALAVVLCAAMFSAYPGSVPVVRAETAAVQKYQDQMKELEATQAELQKKIDNAKNEAADTAETKQNLDYLVSTISSKITTANALLSELNTKIAATEQAIAEHEASIAYTSEKFLERMRMTQEDGNVSYLSVLLGADSISDFLSRLDRVNSMLEYDNNMLKQYKSEKSDLEAEKADLDASKALQEDTLATLEADKKKNETLSAQAASYYDSLQSDTAEYESQKAAAKAAEQKIDAELTAMLKKLAEEQAAKPNPSQPTATGEYMWPVAGGYISCHFGNTDPKGDPHYATDIAVAYGTPIYASNDGTVVTATYHYSYGNYVVINHGNGVSTLYAHCSSLAVSSGATVSKGQVIGYVGSTGYSFGAHLHFEYRINGEKKNAEAYVG